MYNHESQNQDLRSTVSEQIVELNDNELDAVAGGGIGDILREVGEGIGEVTRETAQTAGDVWDALW